MASIFDNYDNLKEQYIPSNMNNEPCPPKANPFLNPAVPKQPYCEYNAEGNVVGYWWPYGNTVNLEFDLDGYVTIDGSDVYVDVRDFIKDKQIKIQIYNFRHEIIDTKLYDGKDYQSITYSRAPEVDKRTHGVYYTYNKETRTYSPVDLPEDFEQEEKYYKADDIAIVYPIDADKSLTFEKGTYYCSLSIVSKEVNETVFFEENCTLMVK